MTGLVVLALALPQGSQGQNTTRPAVLGLVMRHGMALVAVGGVVGAALAAAAARLLSSVLLVRAFDPVSFAVALLVLAAVAAIANWVPARRAARVDPMVVLRGE
jgi:putative ABC transport system permease protein